MTQSLKEQTHAGFSPYIANKNNRNGKRHSAVCDIAALNNTSKINQASAWAARTNQPHNFKEGEPSSVYWAHVKMDRHSFFAASFVNNVCAHLRSPRFCIWTDSVEYVLWNVGCVRLRAHTLHNILGLGKPSFVWPLCLRAGSRLSICPFDVYRRRRCPLRRKFACLSSQFSGDFPVEQPYVRQQISAQWFIIFSCSTADFFPLWLGLWVYKGLKLNSNKTKVMVFFSRNTSATPTFTYDGTPLELVTQFKYLGITLTRNGSMHTYSCWEDGRQLQVYHSQCLRNWW